MDRGFLNGLMVKNIKDSFLMMLKKELEHFGGQVYLFLKIIQMEKYILENG